MPLAYYAYTGLVNAIVCALISAVVLLKRPRSVVVRLFSCLTFLIAAWSWFYFLWLRVTDDAAQADFLMRTCMVAVVLMPALFLHFAAVLTKRLKRRSVHIANYLASVAIALSVYTPAFSPGVAPHCVDCSSIEHIIIPCCSHWPIPSEQEVPSSGHNSSICPSQLLSTESHISNASG